VPETIGQRWKTLQKAAGDLEIANNFQISLKNHRAPLHKAQRQPTTMKTHNKRILFLFSIGDVFLGYYRLYSTLLELYESTARVG
jgi:hypothetical protein